MSRVLIVGNPNSGKTTLFNRLTGKNAKVGNWHGVTVEAEEAVVRGTDITLVDLPGTYSLRPYAMEEGATSQAVFEGADLIVNVVEAATVGRALVLTEELIRRGGRTVVFVTMCGELEADGGSVDVNALSDYLGLPCYRLEDVEDVIAVLKHHLAQESTSRPRRKSEAGYFKPPRQRGLTRADRLLLNPFFALASFAAAMLSVFYLTFGKYGLGVICGTFLKNLMDKLSLFALHAMLGQGCGPFAARLVSEGILGGAAAVVGFIPQLAVMYACLTVLEESGYLSRAAVALDGPLKRVGLSGRAVFPVLMGYGCTASAIMASHASSERDVQRRLVLVLHFVSCSARMPIISLIVSTFFPGRQMLAVTLVYSVGLALGLLASRISAIGVGKGAYPLVTELSPLRIPRPSRVLKQLNYYVKTFIIRIGTTLLAVSVTVWLACSFSADLRFLGEEEIGQSILARIGQCTAFLFRPMGVEGWQVSVAALCGLVAKEGVVGSLAVLYPMGIDGTLSSGSAAALLFFFAFYTPCVAALAASAKEVGGGLCAFYAVFAFLFALLGGYVIHLSALLLARFGEVRVLSVAVAGCASAASVLAVIKKIRTRKCYAQNCFACKVQACKADISGGGNTLLRRKKAYKG